MVFISKKNFFMFSRRETLLLWSLSLLSCFRMAHSAIVIDFDQPSNGKQPRAARFTFRDIGKGTTQTERSPHTVKYSLRGDLGLGGGAGGRLSLELTPRSNPNPSNKNTTAAKWEFGPEGLITQDSKGYGIIPRGNENVPGTAMMDPGEAMILKFDMSQVRLGPDQKLAFRVRLGGNRDESAAIYERVRRGVGTFVAKTFSTTRKKMYNVVIGGGFEGKEDVYEFAVVDPGFEGVGGKNRIASIWIGAVSGTNPSGALKLHSLFTDNVVLQRMAPVAVFGFGTPGKNVLVSFGEQKKEATVSGKGRWTLELDPMEPTKVGRSMTVADGISTQKITNVVVGDVWLASGQSNMDREWKWYKSLDAKAEGNKPNIRILSLYPTFSDVPLIDAPIDVGKFDGGWKPVEPKYLEEFSPAAYFFAEKVAKECDITIGVLESAQGASRAELWTPSKALRDLGYSIIGTNSKGYNGMIHPVRNFTFKGIIWSQGETNGKTPVEYEDLFQALITSWREEFGQGDLPFYYAQLSSVETKPFDKTGDQAYARLRESQAKALRLPNTRMIVTTDVGEYKDLHPQDKKSVGLRFAYNAIEADSCGTGGYTGRVPVLKSTRVAGNELVLKFSARVQTKRVVMNRDPNLMPRTDPNAFTVPADVVSGFTLWDDERKEFVPADGRIEKKEVFLSSPSVRNPTYARYCWMSFGLCNLYSMHTEALPIGTFRTDTFAFPPIKGRSPITGERNPS